MVDSYGARESGRLGLDRGFQRSKRRAMDFSLIKTLLENKRKGKREKIIRFEELKAKGKDGGEERGKKKRGGGMFGWELHRGGMIRNLV